MVFIFNGSSENTAHVSKKSDIFRFISFSNLAVVDVHSTVPFEDQITLYTCTSCPKLPSNSSTMIPQGEFYRQFYGLLSILHKNGVGRVNEGFLNQCWLRDMT